MEKGLAAVASQAIKVKRPLRWKGVFVSSDQGLKGLQ